MDCIYIPLFGTLKALYNMFSTTKTKLMHSPPFPKIICDVIEQEE